MGLVGRSTDSRTCLYLAFPMLDFVAWFYFRLASGITIPW